MDYKQFLRFTNEELVEAFIGLLDEIEDCNKQIEELTNKIKDIQQKHMALMVLQNQFQQLKSGELDEKQKKEIEEAIERGKQYFGIKDEREVKERIKLLEREFEEGQKRIEEFESEKKKLSRELEIVKFIALLK